MKASQSGMGRGRRGGLNRARELVAMLGSLDDEGDAITPAAVEERFGVGHEDALLLIYLLFTSSSETDVWLPLYEREDEEGGVGLSWSRGARGRPLRLTMGETVAVESALDQMGVPADDAIRLSLERSVATRDVDLENLAQEVERALSPVGKPSSASSLAVCSRAILEGHAIRFLYQGVSDDEPRLRLISPTSIQHSEGLWYVAGVDAESWQERSFRTDRMRSPSDAGAAKELPGMPPMPDEGTQEARRVVKLRFSDRHFLQVFEWPGLEVVRTTSESVTATIPDYGTEWLPRHIAACGGTVTTTDQDLSRRVGEVARHDLTRASSATS